MQDEGELVEREGGAGAEDEGEELDPRAARLQGELQDAGDGHADDAEHGVVDVQSTRRDDAAGAEPGAASGARDPGIEAGQGEGEDEADEQEEQRPFGIVEHVPRECGEED